MRPEIEIHNLDPTLRLTPESYQRITELVMHPQANWPMALLELVYEWGPKRDKGIQPGDTRATVYLSQNLGRKLLALLLRDYASLWARTELIEKLKATERAIDEVIEWYASEFSR